MIYVDLLSYSVTSDNFLDLPVSEIETRVAAASKDCHEDSTGRQLRFGVR